MQNENSGTFVQTLTISGQRQQSIKASTGSFYHEALCDPQVILMKSALRVVPALEETEQYGEHPFSVLWALDFRPWWESSSRKGSTGPKKMKGLPQGRFANSFSLPLLPSLHEYLQSQENCCYKGREKSLKITVSCQEASQRVVLHCYLPCYLNLNWVP